MDLYKTAAGNRYGSVNLKTTGSVTELKYLSLRVFFTSCHGNHSQFIYNVDPVFKNSNVGGGGGDEYTSSHDDDDDIEVPLFCCRHKGRLLELQLHTQHGMSFLRMSCTIWGEQLSPPMDLTTYS